MSNEIGWYTMENHLLDQGECKDDFRRVNCFYKKYKITKNLQKQLEIFHKIKWSRFKNVVAIYDYYQEDQETVYLFMEKCNNDLSSYNKNLKEKEKNLEFYQNLISQVSKGYLELKSLKILHRDIKPNNILVVEQNDTPIYKICDFDISKKEEDVQRMRTDSQQGTVSYSAPEIKESKYSYAADMFSFGLTIFQLLAGDNSLNRDKNKLNSFYTLLQSKSFEDILKEQKIKLNIDSSQSLQIVKILNKMIVYQPDHRISWEDLSKNIFNLKEFDKNQVGIQQIPQKYHFKSEQSQDQYSKQFCDATLDQLSKDKQFLVQQIPLNPQFNNVQNQFKGCSQFNNQNFNFPVKSLNNNEQLNAINTKDSNKQLNLDRPINFRQKEIKNDFNFPSANKGYQMVSNQVQQNKAEDKHLNQQMDNQQISTPIKFGQPPNDWSNNQKSNEKVPFFQNQKNSNQILNKQNFINSPHQNTQQRESIGNFQQIGQKQQQNKQFQQQNRSTSALNQKTHQF